jgi:small subunit ribosomal protein S8
MTDTIADMLTRIRNASRVRKAEVYIPFSKIKLEIAKILKKEGFIEGYDEIKPDKGNEEYKFGGLMLTLKYKDNVSVITTIDRVSKPGRRVYKSNEDLPRVMNDLGMAIVSTSHGIMTNKQARKSGLGGEVLCELF